ncbi:hypothetical protein DPX39_100169100 [Trypanosoma brucei equiperdum]|uniref:Uncharacterized protein n=1 Tax=Trypanosoma brucei equiperdum TaxID=630700 RepID=A0A3L6L2C9_9TRYP|nr:hypothetical protein DPX39_100169100 [Trypanosoma brucei equiperdum]
MPGKGEGQWVFPHPRIRCLFSTQAWLSRAIRSGIAVSQRGR